MASLYKIPFVLVAAYTTGVALTAPVPKPKEGEIHKEVPRREKIFARIVRSVTASLKVVIWGGAFCETAVILARAYPSHTLAQQVIEHLVWGPASSINRVGISPLFLAGCGIATVSGYLRILCFRALGQLFTYEITIRDGHRLVTSGPYSVVRHPSYTTLMLGVTAVGLTHMAPGSWFRECGLAETTLGKAIAWGYLAWMMYGMFNLTARTPQEDAILKKEFGKEWEEYARRVPYRLIPGIY
ncbi:uncharacterized protein C8Q71DRAFT_708626 [Rhodofomes roseus]|uniref:Protein-S-isoprenylcysteine O-methyltransferase n=1 Tax=Rhodofomes roseus TaxID=34475 RepID=A0A4Y9Z3E6_9APHY|nr:uncharacterized protein C8Q71DRAFT_708626 [Rhodofomes roseus]KAH9836291.1 hypothetical protein C8Q71DRAFT_708626 [Rhodofomes roseus]TFY68507.1 hypothetical protein EVJ58_g987 [Rhodofomes roseus]